MDTDILPGKKWHDEIQTALQKSDFGLLLVSPAFFASDYIKDHELQQLLAKSMVVPVALHPTLDFKGLAERQIFRDNKKRTFDGCRDKRMQRAFVLQLHNKINALLAQPR